MNDARPLMLPDRAGAVRSHTRLSEQRFAILWSVLFFLLGWLKALYHEPWRDEAGLWLHALNNGTLRELYAHISYGGHPYLWLTVAWLAARISSAFFTLQFLSLAAASAGSWVVLRFSPFSRFERVLIVFGYYFAFEYSVVNRPYVLLLPSSVLACVCLSRAMPLGAGLAAAMLAQSSVFGAIIAIALTAVWLTRFERFSDRLWFLVPSMLGIAAAVWQMIPPPDHGYATETFMKLSWARFAESLFGIFRGLVTVPKPRFKSWETNFFDNFSSTHAALGFAGLVLLCLLAFEASKESAERRRARVFTVLATLGIFAFTYFKLPGSLRHHGHYYFVLLIALWLAGEKPKPSISKFSLQTNLFMALLSLQFAAALYATGTDLFFPFSSSAEAAALVKSAGVDDRLLVGDPGWAAAPVSLYLKKDLYYPDAERYGSFVILDNRRKLLSEELLLKRTRLEMERTKKKALLILNHDLASANDFHLIARTAESIAPNERYFLYLSK